MELRAGYKQTDAGVIPEEWELKPFTKALRISSGQVDPRLPEFRSMVLVAPDHLEENTGRLISKVTAQGQGARSGKYKFSSGDILYSKIRPYLNKILLARFDGLCSADIYPIKAMVGVDGEFCFYSLLDRRFVSFASTVSVRNAIPKINRDELAQYALTLPPLPEQRAIAAALSDADALIASLDALIAKKRDLKQAAMQQLLTGETRLPGFTGEWAVKRLGDIGCALIGLTYRPSDIRSSGTLVLRSSNIQNGVLAFDDNVFVNPEAAQSSIVEVGDLLICARNGSRDLIGKSVRLDERARGMAFGAFMAAYRSNFNDFISFQFQSGLIRRQINEHLGATINQITNKSLLSFEVPIPSDRSEQTAIAEVLSDMEAELVALKAQAAKAYALKQGMMQELLTGRIRLA